MPQISGVLTEKAPAGFLQGKRFLIPLETPIEVEREAILTSLLLQVIDVSKRLINH
jgi:hypothetical protein